MRASSWYQEWFGNIRADFLSGLVVALALIPEAIAFSVIAGVDPKVALYASFSMAVVIAFAGGRPAMISAATGAMALLMVDLVKDHGLQYLFATTIVTGLLQVIIGVTGLAKVMRFVSVSVMTGFVNGLTILVFMAQLPELIDVSWQTYPLFAGGVAMIYLIPRLTKAIPSPLISTVILTVVVVTLGVDVRTVSDLGELPSSLPTFFLPDIPWNLETLRIILPYAIPLSIVGLLESLMTASMLDDITDTKTNRNRESSGQGIANIVTGFFGGMAGCAMIGQSMINVRSGGRGRFSTFVAGAFLLLLVVVMDDLVGKIPMAALVAVMIVVCIGTFNWKSILKLRSNPRMSSLVMLATVAMIVATHNLAYGVIVGVLLSGIFFAWKISQFFSVNSSLSEDDRHLTFEVVGQVFFASAESFINALSTRELVERVTIDVSRAHFWDTSAIAALDKVVLRLRRNGADVDITGLNDASATMVDRLATHNKPGTTDILTGH